MIRTVYLVLGLIYLTACAHQAKPHKKEEIVPFEAIKNGRHPTCDPHPYIYGEDEKGFWQSNGCSRQYLH